MCQKELVNPVHRLKRPRPRRQGNLTCPARTRERVWGSERDTSEAAVDTPATMTRPRLAYPTRPASMTGYTLRRALAIWAIWMVRRDIKAPGIPPLSPNLPGKLSRLMFNVNVTLCWWSNVKHPIADNYLISETVLRRVYPCGMFYTKQVKAIDFKTFIDLSS